MSKDLNAFLEENGLSDKDFGGKIGRSRMQVFRYRHGQQIPGKSTMQKISQVTGGKVSPSSFYTDITSA